MPNNSNKKNQSGIPLVIESIFFWINVILAINTVCEGETEVILFIAAKYRIYIPINKNTMPVIILVEWMMNRFPANLNLNVIPFTSLLSDQLKLSQK